MNWNFSELLTLFSKNENSGLLLSGKWGLEKESLRITPDGALALTPHPQKFGNSDLITTDFSESQLELITPPFNCIEDVFHYLQQIHFFAVNNLGDELLWPFSMPGKLPEEDKIPIARYGTSEEARKKEIYRRGIALRYGKKMQMICGLHYNFSFSDRLFDFLYKNFDQESKKQDFVNEIYFALARNFMRYRWMLVYLFGASPVVDESYETDVIDGLEAFWHRCPELRVITEFHKENAISLRMSKYGYSNTRQYKFRISYDNLENHISDIRRALSLKHEPYTKLGLFRDKKQVQLNDNLLQIENEYYSPIRFKQHLQLGEIQLDALEKRGINHIEIRALDLDPFEAVGTNLAKLHFLQVFFLFCLFEENVLLDKEERDCVNRNQRLVALEGRILGLELKKCKAENILLKDWGNEIFQKLRAIAELLDQNLGTEKYVPVVDSEAEKLNNKALLPSSRLLEEMKQQGESFVDIGRRLAEEHREALNKNNELRIMN